jgi:hypothetical protein
MVYMQMLFALAFDKLIFSVTPGILSILGSSLILGSAIYVAIRKGYTKAKEDIKGQELAALDMDEAQGFLDGMDEEEKDSSSTGGSEIGARDIDVEEQRH